MSTKSELYALLLERQGQVLSGEEAAERLGVSRAAVWKGVKALREQGLQVESAPGSGYRLPAGGGDVLTPEVLRGHMGGGQFPIRVFQETDSTNLAAKRWALEDAPHGALVVAARQTAGRGRLGRSFQSPEGGVYLSVVLRPRPGSQAVLATVASAVAVCRAVETLCGLSLSIKWVNDLYHQNRKCCGILTEAGTGMENGDIEYMVVGIGLNYTTPQPVLDEASGGVAVALFPAQPPPVGRAELAAAIHRQLVESFASLEQKEYLPEYRARSLVLGRQVTVLAQPPYTAKALAIDDEARLLVEDEAGGQTLLSYGEISVKL